MTITLLCSGDRRLWLPVELEDFAIDLQQTLVVERLGTWELPKRLHVPSISADPHVIARAPSQPHERHR
jgi:hypothetical protein